MRTGGRQGGVVVSRRTFVEVVFKFGVFVAIGGAPAMAFNADARGRARGTAQISVREHGAIGDGKHDETDAFQSAVDALPDEGGTLNVPAGTYLIDPMRSIRLRSRMHLSLAADATLQAVPNAAPRAYVLLGERIQDLEISGGRIIGERDAHLGAAGEWGHGIRLRGCQRVTVRDMRISRCWGDGISAGGFVSGGKWSQPGRDLVLAGVQCEGNRRQGLTLGSHRGVHVSNCRFDGNGGTAPGAGIDIEPDADVARDVVIENCQMNGNRGAGIQLYKRCVAVTVKNCTIERNRGPGILVLAALDSSFVGNQVRDNGASGISIRKGSRNLRITGNRLKGNLRPGAKQIRIDDGNEAIHVDSDNRHE